MNRETLITEIRQLTVKLLGPLAQVAIEDAAANLAHAESGASMATVLLDNKKSIRDRFGGYLGYGFDELVGIRTRKIDLGDYPSLSVVDAHFVEAANALEGMINYSRNTNIQALISFNTRLNELFDDQTIDETNSPLDPDRIAIAFVDALAPLEIDQQYILPVYRCFNQRVLHRLDQLLHKASDVCIAAGLLPGLIVDGRSREAHLRKRSSVRPTNSPMERAFSKSGSEEGYDIANSSAQLDILIRELLWSPSEDLKSSSRNSNLVQEVAVPTAAIVARYFPGSLVSELGVMPLIAEPDMWVAGREVVQISDWQLIALLDHVQDRMIEYLSDSQDLTVDFRRFTGYLGDELLESSPAGKLNAIDGESLDTILTINLLYDAFCNDVSLVDPIKELIAATQVVMMKMALDDPQLLSRPGHPVRLLLNEVASAGVGGLDYAILKADPVFVKLESILIRLVTEYNGSGELVTELLEEFSAFKAQSGQNAAVSAGSGDVSEGECQGRISETHHYVRSKIEERIQEPLHPLIDNLVRQHFHRFLVGIVQRHGQGSNSWILVIKILDLLLWTVRSEKKQDDRQRFEKLNAMLLPNIKKVLLVSGLGQQASDDLVVRLEKVQEDSFSLWRESSRVGNVVKIGNRTFGVKDSDCSEEVLASLASESPALELLNPVPQGPAEKQTQATEFSTHKETQQYLPQVDNLPIGSWLSFQVESGQSMYCTLTARLPADDRLMFANSKGVKVLENTREGLARELQQGSARIVSEWPLFERGMESVIARLRERQQQ